MAREAIKKWTEHQHLRTWKDMPGCRHSKLFISKLCKKRADDLLKLKTSTEYGSNVPHRK
jgi:hypothetical protein